MLRIVSIVVGVLVLIGAGLFTWTKLSPKQLRAEITIDASPEEVWAVLTDFDAYPEWNPFIIRSSGVARVGERLENTLVNDGSTMTFRPRVKVAEPGRELRWLGRFGLPGIVDGEHYFRLEPGPDGGTTLVQGETFTGMLVPFAGKAIDVVDGFEKMNEALKRRVETGR